MNNTVTAEFERGNNYPYMQLIYKLALLWFPFAILMSLIEHNYIQALSWLVWGATSVIGLYWEIRRPIVRITQSHLVLYHSSFFFPKKLPLADIVELTEEPWAITLTSNGGKRHSIWRDWFKWEDYPRFVSELRSLVPPGA